MSFEAKASRFEGMENRRRAASVFALVIAMSLTAGCSQTADSAMSTASRQAAVELPAERLLPTSSAGSTENSDDGSAPENDESIGALGSSRLGVFTCVSNRTSADLIVKWIWADTSEGDGSVAPGGHRCAEGTSRSRQLVLGVSVTLPGARTPVKWFFGGTHAFTDATRSARCFSPLPSPPYLWLATCWSSTTNPPSRETATMPGSEGGYAFEVVKRPTDQNALGGQDLSGQRWHRFEISVTG